MAEKMWLSSPHMGGSELKYIQTAFDTNWIAPLGKNVDDFEKSLSNYLNSKYVAALSSGTSAIHLALIMLGVEQNDEVLVSSFTFSASVNPIIYQKAIPVFIDSEKNTWNMDPELLEIAIKDRLKKGKKPKAIVLVHLYGMPAKIKEIMHIAEKYDIPVIEDAAEALGSKYNEQFVGTFGKIGILSFNGNKIITTSGGGALITNYKEYYDQTKFLATQARDDAPHYEHSEIGFNYRMSNVLAGIGLGQMEVLNERINQRRTNFNFYVDQLSKYSFIEFVTEDEISFSNRWLTTIFLNDNCPKSLNREIIRLNLENDNIETRPLWKPMHLQPVFNKFPNYMNNVSEKLFNSGLCLPSGSNLTENDKERIILSLSKILNTYF